MKIPVGNGQLSLVALFGEKQQTYPDLWKLIEELQNALTATLGKRIFEPYGEYRVHGTLIGLEGYREGKFVWNTNFNSNGKIRIPMNLSGLLDFVLTKNPVLPVTIQIGGFIKNKVYPFTSRGQSPYLRSFSIQGDIAVAVGWPIQNQLYTSGVDALRRSMNQFNVLHKYHDSVSAHDNDFFFVLGNVSKDLNQNMIELCQNRLRDILSHNKIPPIQISKNQLNVVAYTEKDSSFRNAEAGTLCEAKKQIEELIQFYPKR